MTTDIELLELAAKAARIKIDKSATNGGGRGNTGFDCLGNAVLDWHNDVTWNPLTDDGDAMKLAVKLKIIDMNKELDALVREEQRRYPRAEATRRAIVRIAANIGIRMKP